MTDNSLAIRKELFAALMATIGADAMKPGDRLPSEMELAERFRAGRANARFCFKLLERYGIVVSNKRGGTTLLKKPDFPTVRALNAALSRTVHVFANPTKSKEYHWNETTLHALEKNLSEYGYLTRQYALPLDVTRDRVEELLIEIGREGSAALAILPRQEEEKFFLQRADIVFQYHENVFMLASGGQPLDECPFNVLRLDPFREGVRAAEYLVSKGVREVVYIDSEDSVAQWSRERYRGLRFGFQRKTDRNDAVALWMLESANDYSGAVAKIKNGTARPCLAIPNIRQAASFMETAKNAGLTAPERFRAITFNDLAEYREWDLTTVAPPFEDIGERLAALIADEKRAEHFGAGVHIALEPDLIERSSV